MQFVRTIKEVYDYREMLFNLVRKDLRTRYKGSLLGFLWTFLNPLLQLVVYTAVFSTIMKVNIKDYDIFLFVALIPWTFFTASLQGGATSVVYGKDLIKKIYFPRIVLPLATVGAAFMNMVFSMVIVFIALFASGIGLSVYALYLPLIMVLEFIFVLGLAILFAALDVYFRDLEHILGIVTMAWFYATPIVYSVDMVPQKYLGLFYLNPMTSIIGIYRDVLYYKQPPTFHHVRIILFWSVLIILVGVFVFNKLQKRFVEEL